jgi:hypothetical protein
VIGAVDDLPRQTEDGLYSIMLRPCTAEILRHLLDPDIPYVWVVGHDPYRYLEWWTCSLPLRKSGSTLGLEVRGLRFDLLMSTSAFLSRLSEFDGLSLFQMRRKVPNTLAINGGSTPRPHDGFPRRRALDDRRRA